MNKYITLTCGVAFANNQSKQIIVLFGMKVNYNLLSIAGGGGGAKAAAPDASKKMEL